VPRKQFLAGVGHAIIHGKVIVIDPFSPDPTMITGRSSRGAANRLDVAERIRDFNVGRDPERLAMKYAGMAESAFAFLRGTCHLFWQDWPRKSSLDAAPLAWICGDLHLENFGSFRGDNRLTYFDINDFDEATLAPCTWDTVRLATSILLAGDDLACDAAARRQLARTFVDAYAAALGDGKARWIERQTATGLVGDLLSGVEQRRRVDLLDKRTVVRRKRRRHIVIDGVHALAAPRAEIGHVERLIGRVANASDDPAFWRVRDLARRVSGLGSLGVPRWVILVEGNGSPDRNILLDLKRACPTAVGWASRGRWAQRWSSDADRVVGVQQRLQAASPALLRVVVDRDASYVLRALEPREDRVRLKAAKGKMRRLADVIRTMGEVLAWDHLRASGRAGAAVADDLVAFGRDDGWRRPLIEYASQYAEQVRLDWRAFRKDWQRARTPLHEPANRRL